MHLDTPFIRTHHGTDLSPSVNGEYTLHCHNHYEIYFFIQGDLDYLIEGHNFKPTPYSILLIPPNHFHGFKHNTSHIYDRYSCHFAPIVIPEENQAELLSPFYSKNIYFPNIHHYEIQFYMDSILQTNELPESIREISLQSRLVSLLTQIFHVSKSERKPTQASNLNYSMEAIFDYVSQNLDKKLSLEALSKKFFISKNHLNRLFRASTGTTVNNYINYKRLTKACYYIHNNQSATEAAANAGFGNYSSFYRTCQNILGVSPSEIQTQGLT